MSVAATPSRLGAYTRLRRLGRSRNGKVWHARHDSGVEVALKVPRLSAGTEATARFYDEVRAMARLDHAYIVELLDVGELDDPARPYFATRYVPRGSVADHPPRSFEEVSRGIQCVLEALAHAHARDVLHLDLKAENVLVTQGGLWQLADFGIAKVGVGVTSGAGSPVALAPERLSEGLGNLGPTTDLYAVGCMLWELLTGRPPFEGDLAAVVHGHLLLPPPDFVPRMQAPLGVEAVIRQLLAKRPEDRPPTAAHALRSWRQACGQAARTSDIDRVPRRRTWMAETWRSLLPLREPRFVGRRREQEQIWSRLRATLRDGLGRATLLHGSGGMGTSALACRVARRAEELLGARRVEVLAPDAPGLDPLKGLLTPVLGGVRSSRRARQRLEATGLDEDAASVLADWWFGAPAARATRLACLARHVVMGAPERLLVVVVEDIHLGGEPLDWVLELLRQQAAVFVLCTAEDGQSPPRLSLLRAHTRVAGLHLGPLDRTETVELARSLVPFDLRDSMDLFQATWGNPGRVVEELRGAHPARELECDDWDDALRAAATWGPVCAVADLRGLCEHLGVVLDDATLAQWARNGYASMSRDRSQLTLDPHVRAAVRNGTPGPLRRGLHDAIASLLQERGDPPEAIAHHLARAGRASDAVPLWMDAAYHHITSGDPHTAEALLQQWERHAHPVDVEERLQAARLWCIILRRTDRLDDALRQAGAFDVLARQHGDSATQMQAAFERATLLERLGALEQSADEVERGLALDADAPDDRSRLWLTLAHIRSRQQRPDEAMAAACQAAEVVAMGATRAGALRWLGAHLFFAGDLDGAARTLLRARAGYARDEDLRGLGDIDNALADIHHVRGELEEAAAHFERAARRLSMCDGGAELVAYINLATVRLSQGRPEDAKLILDWVVPHLDDQPHAYLRDAGITARVATWLQLHEWDLASADLRRLEAWPRHPAIEPDQQRLLGSLPEGTPEDLGRRIEAYMSRPVDHTERAH